MLARNGIVRIAIMTISILVSVLSAGSAHGDDDGGMVLGVGFGTASLTGDLADSFPATSVAGRMRVGLRYKSFGAEIGSHILSIDGPRGSDWVAMTFGPSLLYQVSWRPLALYVRGGMGIGTISGGQYDEIVPCVPPEDCIDKEVTVTPAHPAYSLELAAGAEIHLKRKSWDSHPVLWIEWTVRHVRARITEEGGGDANGDSGVLGGQSRQLAIGVAYGRDF